MFTSLSKVKDEICTLEKSDQSLRNEIKKKEMEVRRIEEKLYDLKEKELHISEILRLATYQIPRLRNDGSKELIQKDYDELDKWIRRVKGIDGLKDIVNALNEMSKYYPSDIKSNIYAIIQRIIIEGPFPKKGKKKSNK